MKKMKRNIIPAKSVRYGETEGGRVREKERERERERERDKERERERERERESIEYAAQVYIEVSREKGLRVMW